MKKDSGCSSRMVYFYSVTVDRVIISPFFSVFIQWKLHQNNKISKES